MCWRSLVRIPALYTLDWHFLQTFAVKIVMFVWKEEHKQKEAGMAYLHFFVYDIDCVKKSLFFTKSCTCVECEPTPPKHAKANDGVGRAAHRRVTGYVPTAESGPDHFGCYKGWKRVTKYLVLPFSFLRWWYYNHGSLGGTDYVGDLYSLLTINSKWWGHQTDHWVM